MFVIIVGAGKTGTHLAAALARRGERVTLVDADASAAARAGQALHGVTVVNADGASPSGLRQAGAPQARALVAVTGSDASNLLAATLARREFGVPRVLARAYDPAHGWLYTPALGVDVVLDGADLLAQLVEEELKPADLQHAARLRRAGRAFVEVPLPADSSAHGRPLCEVAVPAACALAAVYRAESVLAPEPGLVLEPGDVLLAVASGEQAEALAAALAAAPVPGAEERPPLEVIPPAAAEAEEAEDAEDAEDAEGAEEAPAPQDQSEPAPGVPEGA